MPLEAVISQYFTNANFDTTVAGLRAR